ncbi:PREDICTED: uncharacterized protein LOC101297935 [Fragaria vesca subsp. vesca]|uniref:uncharacterized protein LOC101297935 n=1 Tax=Fragaria vesca subsp. vesca TaxID=101020 RepID=UPI0002C2E16D|nr:PREDICTED: uncharacterized protein LOC101297935 [Fragaria vesca subsp. vesca]
MCSSMAELESESYTKPQKVVSSDQNHENQSKFYNHFLYKIALVVVFFVILPLFPSQAPEFINQSLITRSWELLHLLLVGIAVSYGLFSRLNEKVEKENNTKFDNAHSYVSRILQVPSVFDDEAETSPGLDESKVQAWSSQYFRNEPVVVVAQEHSVLDEHRDSSSIHGEKPLLLPVRSLKQRVPDQETIESVDESSVTSGGALSRSNSRSGSRRFSSRSIKARAGETGGLDHQELEEKLKESVVLPSPIPWRSRSGRLEVREDLVSSTPMEEAEFNRLDPRGVSRSQSSHSSRSDSVSSSPKLSPSTSLSSPKKLSPAPSLSSEAQAKSVEDGGRKRSFYKSSIPPPPPPPPMFYKSSSLRPSSDEVSYEKDLRRSFTSEAKNLNRSNGEFMMGRVNSGLETKHRLSHVDGISMAKSVRTTRAGEPGYVNGKVEQSAKEVEANVVEDVTRKRVGFNESSFWTEKLSHESSIPNNPKSSAFEEFSEEDEKEDLFDKVVMESDEETESEGDDTEGDFAPKDIGGSPKPSPRPYQPASGNASDGGPDVDKKADEFIAKFREQIRLQRIDSIKKSSAQISKNLSR